MAAKELIRQEIERMLDERAIYKNLEQMTGGSIALARLHSFIDSLPVEPVMDCKDLEEAAMQYLDNHKPLTRYNWGDLMDAFKAGAEWGAEHVKR